MRFVLGVERVEVVVVVQLSIGIIPNTKAQDVTRIWTSLTLQEV
jgi:hypothetical protein